MNLKRNYTALYLRSKPGTGKSLIAKFFCRILKKLARIVKKPAEVLDRFNFGLVGKILVLFEDMPVNSIGEWNKYSDTMLEMITGEELTIEKKHINSYDVNNLVNIGCSKSSRTLLYFFNGLIFDQSTLFRMINGL